jgi:hypothetical protein
MNPDLIYQVGVEPVRVDVMSAVSGLEFSSAWEHRAEATFDEVMAPVLSVDDLIRAKQVAGRAKDRIQARQLENAKSPKRERGKR